MPITLKFGQTYIYFLFDVETGLLFLLLDSAETTIIYGTNIFLSLSSRRKREESLYTLIFVSFPEMFRLVLLSIPTFLCVVFHQHQN